MKKMKATVSVTVVVDVDLKSDNYEEALDETKNLLVTDIVKMNGDHIDSSKLKLCSLWSEDDWLETE